MKLTGCVAWILLCKPGKSGPKNCYNSGSTKFSQDIVFIGSSVQDYNAVHLRRAILFFSRRSASLSQTNVCEYVFCGAEGKGSRSHNPIFVAIICGLAAPLRIHWRGCDAWRLDWWLTISCVWQSTSQTQCYTNQHAADSIVCRTQPLRRLYSAINMRSSTNTVRFNEYFSTKYRITGNHIVALLVPLRLLTVWRYTHGGVSSNAQNCSFNAVEFSDIHFV